MFKIIQLRVDLLRSNILFEKMPSKKKKEQTIEINLYKHVFALLTFKVVT